MVIDFFGQLAELNREIKRETEVLELVGLLEVMAVDDLPVVTEFFFEARQFLAFERRDAATAGNAITGGEIIHDKSFTRAREERKPIGIPEDKQE